MHLRFFAAPLVAASLASGCAHHVTDRPPALLDLPRSPSAGLAPLPSVGCSANAERGHPGVRTITSSGRTRRFHLRLPSDGAVRTPVSLVLNLHGLYQAPPLQELLSNLTAKALARGWVVAYPAGIGRSWNAGSCCGRARAEGVDDVRFLRKLVAQLGRELCIDRRRVYATGMSNGGLMSYRLACEASDLFAAVAPVAAVETVAACVPRRAVPILAFNGTGDYIVHYSKGFFSGWSSLPSVSETQARWEQRKACQAPRKPVWSSKSVKCEAGASCKSDQVLCTIHGGGHTWPGGMSVPYLGPTTDEIDGSATILEFFAGQAIGAAG